MVQGLMTSTLAIIRCPRAAHRCTESPSRQVIEKWVNTQQKYFPTVDPGAQGDLSGTVTNSQCAVQWYSALNRSVQ